MPRPASSRRPASRRRRGPALLLTLLAAWPARASAEEASPGEPALANSESQTPDTTPLAPFPPPEPAPPAPLVTLVPTGYVEAYYAYNFNRPGNGITNHRGFDNRHNTFTLSNAALGASWATGPVSGKVMLQVGSTPSTYYASEPTRAGAGGANATGPELWKYLQEAYVTYEAPVGRGLRLTAGLIASPIGIESFAVKDNWSWSRSNLFFALPFYHAGVRATYPLSDELSATLSVFNGWNAVVDNNEAKSVEAHVTYRKAGRLLAQALYFGGIERGPGAREGAYWRHHFDAFAQVELASWLAAVVQADYGFEPTRFGTARWVAGAAMARVKAASWLYFAARGDRFHEHLATAGGQSAPLFWSGAEWVSSGTATVEVRPHDTISVRLELRHDAAQAPLYFRSEVRGDGSPAAPFAPNARHQSTLLLGATAWF